MSEPPKGRGRGRGKRAAPIASPSPASPEPSTSRLADPPASAVEDAPAPGPAGRRLGRIPATTEARPVGGLLGGSEYVKKEPVVKTRFKPKFTRKARVVDDDDDFDVKMEDNESSFGRGRGRGRGRGARVELEMTASGPMAQGPLGAPKAWGPKAGGFGGAGVMNAARAGGGGGGGGGAGQFDDAVRDPDASDLEDGSDGDTAARVWARELNDIGDEDEMAPMTLPRDPKVVRSGIERRKERVEARIKMEAPIVKPEPGLDDDAASLMLSSANGTPALDESRAGTVDSKDIIMMDVDEKKDFKPLPDFELRQDFDLEDPSRERLYVLQFPRRFPTLVNALHAEAEDVKMEVAEAGATGARKKTPCEWGRAGSRDSRGVRWAVDQGQIGELCVHKSGKVSLMMNGDLHYEILPAAQPSFLQEVVILEHDPSAEPGGSGPSEPDHAIRMMGQTGKKFIVVPEVSHLLERIEMQEKEEKERERRLKALKKEAKQQ